MCSIFMRRKRRILDRKREWTFMVSTYLKFDNDDKGTIFHNTGMDWNGNICIDVCVLYFANRKQLVRTKGDFHPTVYGSSKLYAVGGLRAVQREEGLASRHCEHARYHLWFDGGFHGIVNPPVIYEYGKVAPCYGNITCYTPRRYPSTCPKSPSRSPSR